MVTLNVSCSPNIQLFMYFILLNRMTADLQQILTAILTVSNLQSHWLVNQSLLWQPYICYPLTHKSPCDCDCNFVFCCFLVNPQVSILLPCCQDFPYRFSNENGGYAPVRPRQHQAGGQWTYKYIFCTILSFNCFPQTNCVCLSSVLCAVNILLSFTLQALVHDIYSELVEDACLGLCFEVHRAVKQGYFFLDETDQESMKEFGGSHDFSSGTWMFLCFSLVHMLTICALITTRNCGPARSGHIWASVQSVEEQRVRVPQLQKIDCSVPFRPTLGEMSWNGTQQQSHR